MRTSLRIHTKLFICSLASVVFILLLAYISTVALQQVETQGGSELGSKLRLIWLSALLSAFAF